MYFYISATVDTILRPKSATMVQFPRVSWQIRRKLINKALSRFWKQTESGLKHFQKDYLFGTINASSSFFLKKL